MNTFTVELTDTFAGEANYSWVRRATVLMPGLTHYGYTGNADGSYAKANKSFNRELMRRAKSAMGLTGIRGQRESWGDTEVFRPYGSCMIMFVAFDDN